MDDEPAENISGGTDGGGSPARFEPAAEPATRVEAVVDRLGALYWQKTYGGQDAFTCLVRTILSQNTSDTASQPAHDALMERYAASDAGADPDDAGADPDDAGADPDDAGADPDDAGADPDDAGADPDDAGADLAEALASADQPALADTIASAGLYNQKSETLIRLANRVVEEHGGAAGFDAFVKESEPSEIRDALLGMKGVGPKTADCVLLFAGGRAGVFPVDTHVHRIARRMGLAPPDADHEGVREHLERAVPAARCGFGHTAMILFGRDYCTARKPACLDDPEACPLGDRCDQVGVFPESDEVVDPADATAD